MTDKMKRARHSVYNINSHIVWIPRYRKSVLVGQIAERLHILLLEIAAKHAIDVLAHEIMPDWGESATLWAESDSISTAGPVSAEAIK